MKKPLVLFSAGCVGGLANSLVVWLFGLLAITALFGVSIAPSLTPGWLYPRIVWGGLWGLVFLLPILNGNIIVKGSVLSLLPTAAQLFIVFPFKADKGIAGLDLGVMTPVFVVIFNWVWGVAAALTIRSAKL